MSRRKKSKDKRKRGEEMAASSSSFLNLLLLITLTLAFAVDRCQSTTTNFECSSAMDCELLGECVNKQCVCQSPWTGPTCGTLKLKPASFSGAWPTHRPVPPSGNNGDNSTTTLVPNSWGGTMMRDQKDGKFHLFVTTGCFDTKTLLHEWGYQISHGVSDRIEGPYSFSDTTVPPTAFNPHMLQLRDGTYVLYHLFQKEDPMTIPRCLGNETTATIAMQDDDDVVSSSSSSSSPSKSHSLAASLSKKKAKNQVNDDNVWKIRIASSSSLSGPWNETLVTISGDASGKMMNPSLYQFPNGSILLSYTSLNDETYSKIKFARAESWDGDYSVMGGEGGPMPNVTAEDPFLWRNADGSFHMILHMFEWYGPWPALHAFSADGIDWRVSAAVDGQGVYSTTMEWEDGKNTTFYRRERPELFFDENGKISHLLTSCEYGDDHPLHQYSFTSIQQVDRE